MSKEMIAIGGETKLIIKENVNNVDEFNNLYDAVGWEHYDKEISEIALKNTMYSVSVYDNEKNIGFGRLIGDEICFIYIQDIMVLPEYQGKKIGTMIMNRLLAKIEEIKKQNPDLMVYCGASKNKEDYYRKFGFITREEFGVGSGMILKDN